MGARIGRIHRLHFDYAFHMPAAIRSALIAEDSRIQASFLEQLLMRAGFWVRVAADGEAALQASP